MKKILFPVFFFLTFSVNAQEKLSISQAVEKGLNNAYNLKIANTQIAITEKNNNWGEAGRMPVLTTNLNNSNTYSSIQNPTSFLNGADVMGSNNSLSVDLQWTLYDGGRIKTTKNRLSELTEQSKLDAKVLVDNITMQVSKAYYNVLIQEKKMEMLASMLRLSRDKIVYVETRSEYGQATEFDLLQVKDAYLNDSIQYVIQQTSYINALQNLYLVMGLDPQENTEYILSDSLSYELPDYFFEDLLSELYNNNAQIRAEKIKVRISELDKKLQSANQFPKITIGANASEQLNVARIEGKQPQIPNDWRGGTTTSAALNIGINYTIYNGGKIKRALDVADLRKNISELNVKDLERRLSQQLKIAFNLYLNQKNILNISNQMLKNAEKNLQIAEERYLSGILNYFDFRNIQINYFRTINTLQEAFLNAKNTELDMLLQSGKLSKVE